MTPVLINHPHAIEQFYLSHLLDQEELHMHIHAVDMPYRLTSVWQEHDEQLALWSHQGDAVAWALFQPAWWNFDVAIDASVRGSDLELEIFEWGKTVMVDIRVVTSVTFGDRLSYSNRPRVAKKRSPIWKRPGTDHSIGRLCVSSVR